MTMVVIRDENKADENLKAIAKCLLEYEKSHSQAQIEVYRQNSASVRIRIIDPDFGGKSNADRHDYVWDFLAKLTEDQQSDMSMLVLLTPDEVSGSFANLEFEDRTQSVL